MFTLERAESAQINLITILDAIFDTLHQILDDNIHSLLLMAGFLCNKMDHLFLCHSDNYAKLGIGEVASNDNSYKFNDKSAKHIRLIVAMTNIIVEYTCSLMRSILRLRYRVATQVMTNPAIEVKSLRIDKIIIRLRFSRGV